MYKIKNVLLLVCVALASIVLFLSCSAPAPLVYGSYYSQGDNIIEQSNVDGWRNGHYLLTIDSLNTFVLKEVSVGCGMKYTVCSGYLRRRGTNSYLLEKSKEEYPYGVLGNPFYNENNYHITIRSNDTIILQRGSWETVLKLISHDSIPKDFDFSKYGYTR